jgi:hypothetical protein
MSEADPQNVGTVCSLCCDDLLGPPSATCATCPTGSALCSSCYDKHAKGKGHFAGHSFSALLSPSPSSLPADTRDDPRVITDGILRKLGLSPAPITCAVHPSTGARLVCFTCGDRKLLCSECGTSRHAGHSLELLSTSASAIRKRLIGLTDAPLDSVAAASKGVHHSVIVAARDSARSLAEALDALPSQCDAALQLIETSHDAILVAAMARRSYLRSKVEAAAAEQRDLCAAKLEDADALLQRTEDLAENLRQVRDTRRHTSSSLAPPLFSPVSPVHPAGCSRPRRPQHPCTRRRPCCEVGDSGF